jgi:Coenzyme PQQ synthesis protein D (PqqD)
LNRLRKRAESLVVREMCDGILLLDMEAAQIHQLNATAGFIWRHCDGVASAADIAASVAREYDGEEGAVARDVEMALSELRALNLVVEG